MDQTSYPAKQMAWSWRCEQWRAILLDVLKWRVSSCEKTCFQPWKFNDIWLVGSSIEPALTFTLTNYIQLYNRGKFNDRLYCSGFPASLRYIDRKHLLCSYAHVVTCIHISHGFWFHATLSTIDQQARAGGLPFGLFFAYAFAGRTHEERKSQNVILELTMASEWLADDGWWVDL